MNSLFLVTKESVRIISVNDARITCSKCACHFFKCCENKVLNCIIESSLTPPPKKTERERTEKKKLFRLVLVSGIEIHPTESLCACFH